MARSSHLPILVAATFTVVCASLVPYCAGQTSCVLTPRPNGLPKIQATLESIQVDERHQLLFFYLLRNNTNFAYSVADPKEITVMLRTQNLPHLQPVSPEKLYVASGFDLPPHRQQVIMIRDRRRTYSFTPTVQLNSVEKDSDEEEDDGDFPQRSYERYETEVHRYVSKMWPDLRGFVLCDPARDIYVALPKHW